MRREKLFTLLLTFFVSILISAMLFGTEVWLAKEEWEIELGTTARVERAAKKYGVEWDKREKIDVISNLRSIGKDAYPVMAPSVLIESDGLSLHGEKIFPLSGISRTTNVFCNEMGSYSIYDSDEHGFNNPAGSWLGKVDIALIGDSFIHGACLKQGQDIASQLRDKGFRALNLGIGGAGPIIYSAVLKEYAEPIQPKLVVWSFYAVDIRDPIEEKKSLTLMRYLEETGFSQGLFANQMRTDKLLREYYKLAYQQRLDELTEQRKMRRQIITTRLIKEGLMLTKLRERVRNLGGRDTVREGRENEKLELFQRTLYLAKERTEAWGGKLVFMYLPDWYSYGAPYDTYGIKIDENFLLRQNVLSIAKEIGVPILDIQSEVFDKHPDPLSLFNWRAYGHYNLEGYTAVSEKLADFAKKMQLQDRK
jgi:hypothetical protein